MKINIKQAIVALIMLTSLALFAGANPVHVFAVVGGMVLLSLGAYQMKKSVPGLAFLTIEVPDFTEKSEEELKEMSAADFEKYLQEKERYTSAVRRKETLELIAQLKKEDGDTEKLAEIEKQMNTLIEEHDNALLQIKELSEKGTSDVPVGIKERIIENKDKLKAMVENGSGKLSIDFEVKAGTPQNPSDIGNRTDFAQMLPGIDKIPHRRTYIKSRIRIVPTNKEYVKYT